VRPYRRELVVSSRGGSAASSLQSSPNSVVLSQEAIARRAYRKWQARGCPSGTHLQDWLEAEAELKAELGQGQWS